MPRSMARGRSRSSSGPAAAASTSFAFSTRVPGLPEGFAPDRHSAGSLGMKLVALLVSQLDGRLTAGANPAGRGACFTVTFPHG